MPSDATSDPYVVSPDSWLDLDVCRGRHIEALSPLSPLSPRHRAVGWGQGTLRVEDRVVRAQDFEGHQHPNLRTFPRMAMPGQAMMILVMLSLDEEIALCG